MQRAHEDRTIAESMWVNEFGYPVAGDAALDRALKHRIDELVEVRFRAAVVEWARRDDGPLRTRGSLRAEASMEFLVLAEALGSWAEVRGDEIFPWDADGDV